VFREEQVYRIDHYLGKETVQNILVLRFANSIFEPLWNRSYIDHVQITVAEEVKIGERAGYYDTAGVLRDMFQNHLLQLMTIVAMEVPARFEPKLVRDEKVKVLECVRPLSEPDVVGDTLRAQYTGYQAEVGIAPGSATATFAALKLQIDNWRWKGVPFYLRSGKAMSCRTTQIVVQFREPPHMMFSTSGDDGLPANRLVIQIQPAEGIQLHFQTKVPEGGMRVRQSHLDFSFRKALGAELPEAYQRLLLDALAGDASLFARSDEVEVAWRIIDPIIAAWEGPQAPPLLTYEPGNWGPAESTAWMQQQGREWFDVCPVL
jgi:glucose-6-phosphate 1-dehydrogenase